MFSAVANDLQFLPLRNHAVGNTYFRSNYNTRLDTFCSQSAKSWDGKWYVFRELKN